MKHEHARLGVPAAVRIGTCTRLSLLTLSSLGTTAWAADPGTSSGALQEVIVTAQHREESVQDTPIAISAFTGDTLSNQGLKSVEDLQAITPSLQVFSEQVNNEEYIIRGIGRSNEDLTTDSGVAVNINDIYLAQPGEANAAFYDIERVEVLRGPQGTLYGKNAVGGVVNVITRRPTMTVGGEFSAEAGELGLRTATGALGGPLVNDALAARVAVYSLKTDGTYRNLTTGQLANGVDVQAVRGSLLGKPTENLELSLVMDYSDSQQDGVLKSVIVDHPGDRYVLKDFFPVDEFPTQESDIRSSRSETNGSQGIRQWGGSLKSDYHANNGTLSWLVGYRTEDSHNLEDVDRTALLINNFSATQHSWSTSQELRFVSDDSGALSIGGRLHWSAGLYWFHEKGSRDQNIYLRARVPSSTAGDPDNPDDGLLGPGTPDAQDSTASFLQRIDTNSYAAYGQAKYDLTEKFGLTAGLRYTDETKEANVDATSLATVSGGDPYTLFQPEGPYSAGVRTSWNMLTPKAVLEYAATPDIRGYASYARGFKSGGYNGQAGTPGELAPFEPETANNFEIGLKSDLFDRRLRLNVAAFLVDFKNLQVAGTNAQGLIVTTNAANSRITGFEIETLARPIPNLTLRAAASLLNAEFRDYFVEEFDPTITDGPPFAIVDKSGDRLDDVPEYSIALGADYELPLSGGSSLHFGVDSTIKGDTLSNQNTLRASDYTVINARIGWTAPSGALSLTAWVRNLTDEVYYRGGAAVPDLYKDVARVGLVADPRAAGVTVRYRFD